MWQRWALIVGIGAACTGDPPADVLDPATVPLAGVCDGGVDFGGFVVQSSADGGGVEGKVADGVVPISVLEQIGTDGDCRLMRRNNPYCDPACDRGQTCDFEGNCLPYPANQDLGVVALTGLTSPVQMEPVFPGNTYFDTSLANPPFAAGSLVTLDMPDGVYGPAQLHGVGVELLTGTDPLWTVEEGKDLTVRWAVPTGEVVRSTVDLTVSIDQHGASPGVLRCAFDDVGTGTVPSSLVDQLIAVGVTGFPTGTLVRRTADSVVVGAGCMDLVVAHPLTVEVDVEGYTPCFSTADCPDGQTCNIEFQICE